jgi:hypothetical protein
MHKSTLLVESQEKNESYKYIIYNNLYVLIKFYNRFLWWLIVEYSFISSDPISMGHVRAVGAFI